MKEKITEFTPAQWEFITLMDALGEPAAIDVLGELSPLNPAEFLDLLKKIDHTDWIDRGENDYFALSENPPMDVADALAGAHTPDRVKRLIRQIEDAGIESRLSRKALVRLMQLAGEEKKAAGLRIDLCIDALRKGDIESVHIHLSEIKVLMQSLKEAVVAEDWFIVKALALSRACLPRALGLKIIPGMLEYAVEKAARIGDERSWAIANLIIGRYYWATNRLQDAVTVMAAGIKKVEELGDTDMLTHASCHIGTYYFIRGLQNKAIPYLEQAVEYTEKYDDFLSYYEAPILLAYCDVDRGEFHRAIGKIDFFRHCALRQDDYFIASLYRAVLGILLWLVRKKKEALYHLEGSQTDALASRNMVAYWTSLYGMAILYLMDGEIENGMLFLNKTIELADKVGMGHQIFHSIFLESYYLAEKAGGRLPKGWRFSEQFNRIMAEPNIHTKGAALRINAARLMAGGRYDDPVLSYLDTSERLLAECDDPVELAKTKIEKARYYLKHHEPDMARELAYAAYEKMSGYSEIYFPDDLRFLLGSAKTRDISRHEDDDIIEPFIQMMEELIPKPQDLKELDMLLASLSRFFRAERSGLFTSAENGGGAFELRAARNLSPTIVGAENFSESLAQIYNAFNTQKPIVIQSGGFAAGADWKKKGLSILILPLVVSGTVIGVLYFDNSYLDNCFDFIKTKRLNRLGHHLTNIVDKYLRLTVPPPSEKHPPSATPTQAVLPERSEFILKDRKMSRVLRQAEKQAKTDASVLILGETGVGKDLLARWIHRNSNRSRKSFVVVDLTTIPENLMESELFGHERGAFTGADRQKIGRVELAHQGTLFIDEIGEISRDLQVKLLRLLQEKTFSRIGGTKILKSDFRLIAASNRELTAEIKAGRFREDLYYRLNVLEMVIPPLRKRKDDILPLAEYYLKHYKKKYGRPLPEFTREQCQALLAYPWPGNVRELKNLIERAVIVAESNTVELNFSVGTGPVEESVFSDFPTLDELQRRYIRFVVEHTHGRIGGPNGAAKILGMKRTSLNSRMKKLNLK